MNGAPLLLQEVSATSLRCHQHTVWQCEPGLNLLVGENGSGKTSLLEAVFLMGYGRSFRQARDPHLVRHGDDLFSIRGRWTRYGPIHVNVDSGSRGTRICLQGRVLQQRSDLTETLPVLAESPQAARVVDGIPAERRRWLDQMMLYCRPEVTRHYQAYLRCLMQRSRLLRRRAADCEIEVWEHQMAVHGLMLMQVRDELIHTLNLQLEEETSLCETPLSLKLQPSAPTEVDLWAQKLSTQRKQGQRVLRIGPHCDRLQLYFGERDIRAVGSRGQQKMTAVALRLAECRLRMQHRGLIPVLLLDDCFEALDTRRRDALVSRLLSHPGQVLMTGPVVADRTWKEKIHCTTLKVEAYQSHNRGCTSASSGLEAAA
ncbi:MAG: DNA replication and repair protein RecF [Mariprofundaceae bacterium]